MDVRPLRDGEQTALLDLAGLWPAPDHYPMRDLFARYVEDDPRFDPSDVWVADDAGTLVACVQVFPRKLVIHGSSVPTGGIGTVFTHPDRRGRGLAAELMRAAMQDMQDRGFELGLLFAGPVAFYEKLGWHSWTIRRPLLRGPEGGDPAAVAAAEAFDAARDLAEVQAVHADYARVRDGHCARDTRDWWASLRHAGHPQEEFRVARDGGRVVAYLRAACLANFLVVLEWGRTREAAGALGGLFAAALTPRADDPLAPPGRPSPELRSMASSVPLLDDALESELAARGIAVAHTDDAGSMFWVASPRALAERFGEPWRPRDHGDLDAPGDRELRLLRRILPPSRFAFWTADRF